MWAGLITGWSLTVRNRQRWVRAKSFWLPPPCSRLLLDTTGTNSVLLRIWWGTGDLSQLLGTPETLLGNSLSSMHRTTETTTQLENGHCSFSRCFKIQASEMKGRSATTEAFPLLPQDGDLCCLEKKFFLPPRGKKPSISSHKSWTWEIHLPRHLYNFEQLANYVNWPDLINLCLTWVGHPGASQMN